MAEKLPVIICQPRVYLQIISLIVLLFITKRGTIQISHLHVRTSFTFNILFTGIVYQKKERKNILYYVKKNLIQNKTFNNQTVLKCKEIKISTTPNHKKTLQYATHDGKSVSHFISNKPNSTTVNNKTVSSNYDMSRCKTSSNYLTFMCFQH